MLPYASIWTFTSMEKADPFFETLTCAKKYKFWYAKWNQKQIKFVFQDYFNAIFKEPNQNDIQGLKN